MIENLSVSSLQMNINANAQVRRTYTQHAAAHQGAAEPKKFRKGARSREKSRAVGLSRHDRPAPCKKNEPEPETSSLPPAGGGPL